MMTRQIVAVIVSLLFAFGSAYAQSDSVVVEGRVVNSKGIPLSNVTVQAKHGQSPIVTRVDGVFSLKVPAAGDSIAFSKEGLSRFCDFFRYNYNGVVILDEGTSSWMPYGQYVEMMKGTAQQYYNAGLKFMEGEAGAEPDYKKAFMCFTRAANMEYAPAIYQLGFMFDEGLGVSQNHTSAAIWYQKAQRNVKALCRLGEMYAEGIGVERDYQKAANYYHEAAYEGDTITSVRRLDDLLQQGLAKRELLQEHKVFDVVETNASFPGGNQACYAWLSSHMRYPREAQEKAIQGRVTVQFVVDKDGSIADVKVLRSPDPLLSKEAERLILNMPKWQPASQNGKTVRSRFNLTVVFKLG